MATAKNLRVQHAEAVAPNVEIINVRLLEGHFRQPEERGELPKEVEVGRRADSSIDRENGKINAKAFFKFTAAHAGVNQDAPAIEIHAVFLLSYRVANIDQHSDEELAAFGDLNGAYNAWPFWREYLYSTLARMGLPPVTLPVFHYHEREDVGE